MLFQATLSDAEQRVLVPAGALYVRAGLITFLRPRRVQALITFKQDERVLMHEARSLKELTVLFQMTHHNATWTVWDMAEGSGWGTCRVWGASASL